MSFGDGFIDPSLYKVDEEFIKDVLVRMKERSLMLGQIRRLFFNINQWFRQRGSSTSKNHSLVPSFFVSLKKLDTRTHG
jgi:hypothetical protein